MTIIQWSASIGDKNPNISKVLFLALYSRRGTVFTKRDRTKDGEVTQMAMAPTENPKIARVPYGPAKTFCKTAILSPMVLSLIAPDHCIYNFSKGRFLKCPNLTILSPPRPLKISIYSFLYSMVLRWDDLIVNNGSSLKLEKPDILHKIAGFSSYDDPITGRRINRGQ